MKFVSVRVWVGHHWNFVNVKIKILRGMLRVAHRWKSIPYQKLDRHAHVKACEIWTELKNSSYNTWTEMIFKLLFYEYNSGVYFLFSTSQLFFFIHRMGCFFLQTLQQNKWVFYHSFKNCFKGNRVSFEFNSKRIQNSYRRKNKLGIWSGENIVYYQFSGSFGDWIRFRSNTLAPISWKVQF